MKLYEAVLTLPGALPMGEDPQPRFRAMEELPCIHDGTLTPGDLEGYGTGCRERRLPYRVQDRYVRSDDLVELRTLVLENAFLKAVFLPDYGGKLWSLYAKDEGRELLFVNPVFRPADLGICNAWTAGGVERAEPCAHPGGAGAGRGLQAGGDRFLRRGARARQFPHVCLIARHGFDFPLQQSAFWI